MSANENPGHFGPEGLSEEQRRVQAELRASFVKPSPPPREDFRAHLRERFVSGDFAPASSKTRFVWRWMTPLAAAAVLLLMLSIFPRSSANWELVEVGPGTASVRLDGRSYPCDDLDPIQAALHPGCRVQVPAAGSLEVRDAGQLVLQLNGQLEMTLPSQRPLWMGTTYESELRGDGRLRVTTGEKFRGRRYRIRAGDVDLTVTGTTFTVIQSAAETCICVLEGEVAATLDDGSVHDIAAGRRLTLDRRAGSFEVGPMRPDERGALQGLRQRASS